MIIDTTYLLPLSGIAIDTDLMKLIAENKTALTFDEIGVSAISLFEIQAKAAKTGLQPKYPIEAIEVINANFRVEPFYSPRIIEISSSLSKILKDYIDCIVLATAVALKEDLVTEDTKIRQMRKVAKGKLGISIFNYRDLVALRSH